MASAPRHQSFIWNDLNVLRDVISRRILCGVPIEHVQLPDLDDIPVEILEWLQKRVIVEEFKVSGLECCEDTTKKLGTFVSASYSTVPVSIYRLITDLLTLMRYR
jgi:hypothetical protein